jgi:putative intracellular protease/amidase
MKKIFGLILVLAIVIGVGFISLSNKNTRGNKGDVKILAVIAKNYGANFNLLLDDFNALGYKTVLTGITKKISSCPWATGMGLPELTVDSLISEIKDVKDYDAVVVMTSTWRDGNPYSDIIADSAALNLIITALDNNVVLYLPCSAPIILCGTNKLAGRKISGVSNYKTQYQNAGAIYMGENILPVTDGNLITGTRNMYYHYENCEAIANAIEKNRQAKNNRN